MKIINRDIFCICCKLKNKRKCQDWLSSLCDEILWYIWNDKFNYVSPWLNGDIELPRDSSSSTSFSNMILSGAQWLYFSYAFVSGLGRVSHIRMRSFWPSPLTSRSNNIFFHIKIKSLWPWPLNVKIKDFQ